MSRKPSVTAIIGLLDKPALVPWAANAACDYIEQNVTESSTYRDVMDTVTIARKNYRTISAQAITLGKEVHAAIDAWIKGEALPSISPQAQTAFKEWLDWMDANNVKSIESEFAFEVPGYKGKMDWLCMIGGKKFVLDFKVAKDIYETNRYQVAGYRSALEGSEPIVSGLLLLNRETGKPTFTDTESTYEQDLKVFMALKNLWYAING